MFSKVCVDYKIPFIIFITILAHVTVTYSFSLTRHYELKSSGTDGKAFEQVIYNIVEGRGINSTIAPPSVLQSWLSVHFSPILYAVAPIYYLFPHIETLLFIHSFFIALAAIPLFFASKLLLKSKWQAFVISLLYLINPFVINAGIWDFHEIAFAPFTISLILWSVLARKKLWLLLFCVMLLATKEHYGLAVLGTGLLWAWHWRDYKFGLSLAALGFISAVVVLKIIMPYFSPIGSAVMLGANSEIGHFSWLYHPFDNFDILINTLSDAIFYIILLLFSFLAQPIFSFIWLFPAIADLTTNSLSNNDLLHHPSAYHTAAIIPVLLIAFCKTISRKYNTSTNIKPHEMIAATALMALVFSYSFISLPNFPNNVWELSNVKFELSEEDKNARDKIAEMMGTDASVSAQTNILPHISVRKEMYMFPNNIDTVDYVVLKLATPFEKKSNMFGLPYFSRNTDKYFTSSHKLLEEDNFGVIFYQDEWLLLKRGAESNQQLLEPANADLQKLQQRIEELDKRKIVIN